MEFPAWINNIDTNLLTSINGTNTPFFDAFYTLFTSKETWIPLYLIILILIFRKYRQYGVWVLVFLIVGIVLSDQLSVFVKEFVQRLRPSHQPLLEGKLNLPTGTGGLYGFVSSHAANTFSFAFLLGKLSKNRALFAVLLCWALLNAYSRVYLGVHYPTDIIAGAILGSLIGYGLYRLLSYSDRRFQRKKIFFSGAWTEKETGPLFLSLTFIVATLLVSARIILKFFN
jgi:undecaprenyl-diphosphatase